MLIKLYFGLSVVDMKVVGFTVPLVEVSKMDVIHSAEKISPKCINQQNQLLPMKVIVKWMPYESPMAKPFLSLSTKSIELQESF